MQHFIYSCIGFQFFGISWRFQEGTGWIKMNIITSHTGWRLVRSCRGRREKEATKYFLRLFLSYCMYLKKLPPKVVGVINFQIRSSFFGWVLFVSLLSGSMCRSQASAQAAAATPTRQQKERRQQYRHPGINAGYRYRYQHEHRSMHDEVSSKVWRYGCAPSFSG